MVFIRQVTTEKGPDNTARTVKTHHETRLRESKMQACGQVYAHEWQDHGSHSIDEHDEAQQPDFPGQPPEGFPVETNGRLNRRHLFAF